MEDNTYRHTEKHQVPSFPQMLLDFLAFLEHPGHEQPLCSHHKLFGNHLHGFQYDLQQYINIACFSCSCIFSSYSSNCHFLAIQEFHSSRSLIIKNTS